MKTKTRKNSTKKRQSRSKTATQIATSLEKEARRLQGLADILKGK